MKKRSFYGTLDRIEGDIAVILAGEDEGKLEISKNLLPEGYKEGDIMTIKFDIKDKKTKDKKEEIEKLINKLANKD
jgi:Protein of unknown function (DUF3006)